MHIASVSETYKCGDVRTMTLWIAAKSTEMTGVAIAAGQVPTSYQLLRTRCAWALASFVRCGSEYGPLLEPDEQKRMSDLGFLFLRTYSELARANLEAGRPLFKVRPKFHGVHHVCYNILSSAENVRTHEVWQEETLAGEVSRVQRRCHSSTSMQRSVERFIATLVTRVADASDKQAAALAQAWFQ